MIRLTGIWVLFLSIVYMFWNCNFWVTKLEFGERLQDVSAFIQMQLAIRCYQKTVLLDGKMRVLSLKGRSLLRLSSGFGSPDGLTIRRGFSKAPSQENVGLYALLTIWTSFVLRHAMPCYGHAVPQRMANWVTCDLCSVLYVVCVVWVCILKRTLVPTAKYLRLLNMTDCESMH